MLPRQPIDEAAHTESENAAALVAGAAGRSVALAGGEVGGDGANTALGEGAGAIKVGLRFIMGGVSGRSDPTNFPPHTYKHRTARDCFSNEPRVG